MIRVYTVDLITQSNQWVSPSWVELGFVVPEATESGPSELPSGLGYMTLFTSVAK